MTRNRRHVPAPDAFPSTSLPARDMPKAAASTKSENAPPPILALTFATEEIACFPPLRASAAQ